MRRMLVAVWPLLVTLGPAIAGPPEKASGKMVFDEAVEGFPPTKMV